MKKFIFFVVVHLFVCIGGVLSQTPMALPYQAVARTAAGNLVINQGVRVRFSIHDMEASGSIVFQETHAITTNAFGLFSVQIGNGTSVNGSMALVNWARGNKFLQTELDPVGGNSFIDMGTVQMMSVPYAMHAKTVEKDNGKTYLLLTGNISDEEAAEKISRNAGPNTQVVKIVNTTRLTSVNLSGLTELNELSVNNNALLSTCTFTNVQSIAEGINISRNPFLTSISLPSIQTLDYISITSNDRLNTISLPSLTSVNSFYLASLPITSLSLPMLKSVENLSLTDTKIAGLDLPGLTQLKYFDVNNNSQMTGISLPNITSLDRLQIQRNNLLSEIVLPGLSTFTQNLQIYSNPRLANLQFPSLVHMANGNYHYMSGNAFSSATVDGILGMFAATGASGLSINLWGQIPPAPPGAAGLAAKALLISNGGSVWTD